MATSITIDHSPEMCEKIDSNLKLIPGIAIHKNLLRYATIEGRAPASKDAGSPLSPASQGLGVAHDSGGRRHRSGLGFIKGSTSRAVSVISSVATSIENLTHVAVDIADAVDDRSRAATAISQRISFAAKNVAT